MHGLAQAFGGGGHRNASGAFVRKSLEETKRLVIDKAPKFIRLTEASSSDNNEIADEDAEYLTSLINQQTRRSVE